MTRIVRFEEIDGKLMFEVPHDVAKQLGFAAGGEVQVSTQDDGLKLEPVDDQLALGRKIADRHREALARLAR